MKTITLIIIALAFTTFSYGQRVVALHSAGTVTMFDATSPLVAAYNASVTGDTIYLPGGAFTPPPVFDKGLVIIGAGVHPDSTTATFPTVITANVNLGENADNIHIEGIDMPYLGIGNNVSVNGFLIRRCKINGTVSFAGTLTNPITGSALIGNILIGGLNINNMTNSIVANNLIQGGINDSESNTFENNVFIYAGSPTYNVIEDCNNNTFSNNVFVNNSIYSISGTGNIFQYNVFENGSIGYGTAPVTIANYTGIAHADILVNQSGSNLDFTHDYHLVYPATYLGVDGSEVGIYGGTFPFKDGAVPMNPHIRTVSISPTTNAAGELSIDITVGAQDN
jgi:hypothetical protein